MVEFEAVIMLRSTTILSYKKSSEVDYKLDMRSGADGMRSGADERHSGADEMPVVSYFSKDINLYVVPLLPTHQVDITQVPQPHHNSGVCYDRLGVKEDSNIDGWGVPHGPYSKLFGELLIGSEAQVDALVQRLTKAISNNYVWSGGYNSCWTPYVGALALSPLYSL